ncbi:MAG TPA: hypothetical protein VNM24_07500 [Burkholderiales bacterium]|nr:hypothetical protein [Burkholderiales bacterium]
MSMFMGFLGVVLLAAVIFGWYWLYRRVRGEEGPLAQLSKKTGRTDAAAELEAFIAAYRSGKVSVADVRGAGTGGQKSVVAAAAPVPRAPPSAASEPPAAALLRPEVKLAYLTLRAALRDHHVFPNVRLSDLGRGTAQGKVDLLVCDPKFAMIAAVDVIGGGAQPDSAKAAFLRESGIRYLRFSTASMPKPADIHTLIYRA